MSLWPFGLLGSAALGAIVLIAFALGVLAGMVALVPHRVRAHRRARRAEKQLAAVQAAQPGSAGVPGATLSIAATPLPPMR